MHVCYNIHWFLSECTKHCSLCYNETECYECTQGYFLTETGECQRMFKYFGNIRTCIKPSLQLVNRLTRFD